MHYQPHDYQRYATRFITEHPHAAILLGMGLGKSVITLTALRDMLLDEFTARRVLVIAPLRVARETWPTEIAKWDHLGDLTYTVAVGTKAQRLDALADDAMITIINRENTTWLVNHYGNAWPFDTVIIDELSSFKNHQASRFKSLIKARPHIERIVGLTGTPASNGLMDLWAEFRLLDGGQRLGRYISQYRNRYFTPDKRNGMQIFTYKPREGAQEQIYDAISDITVSMETTDHLDLPALTMTSHEVHMNKRERAVYDQLTRELVISLNGHVVDASNAAALSAKLTQIASGAVYSHNHTPMAVHERKLDALEDLVEAANGHNLLVAYWYKHDLERIQNRFPSARTLTTPADIADWNAGKISIGLIHPASAGHGLNLQAGGHLLVWFTLTWSLELYQQTNARLYRQGQTEPVTITHLMTAETIEPSILSALESKNTTQDALIKAVKTQLGETPCMS